MTSILGLPDEILDKILTYISYDEVSRVRLVSKRFDASSQRVLNQGFYKVEKYHARCLRKVKEQLPRRESERRKHPLATHCDILTAIETRLSLLGMTFMKYVELKYCCFIPGKVLDEIFKILRFVSTVSVPQRAHEILQELRDISSMAMEHFDEKIAPAFRSLGKAIQNISVTPYGAITGPQPHYASSSSLRSGSCTLDMLKLHLSLRQLHSKYTELKKENIDNKRKIQEFKRKIKEYERKQTEMNTVVTEQSSRIFELEGKFAEYDKLIADIVLQIKEENRPVTSSTLNDPNLTKVNSEKMQLRNSRAKEANNSQKMSPTVAAKRKASPTSAPPMKKRQKIKNGRS